MRAYVFPGQGAQFVGMGQQLYTENAEAKKLFDKANEILGFAISEVMFHGTEDELKQTKVTQPAVFLHSVLLARSLHNEFKPDMVAGHSLGEFSALVAAGALSFEDGLTLVSKRAMAMQKACEATPSTMAAILGLDDKIIAEVCQNVTNGVVVPANYNCPGQVVISGTKEAIDEACTRLKEAGAKRAIPLKVGGAFHSPLMQPAKEELGVAIEQTHFEKPIAPVYQNVVARAVADPEEIKQNLVKQLTSPVRWTECVRAMIADGATHLTELGPGQVLQGLIRKICPDVQIDGLS